MGVSRYSRQILFSGIGLEGQKRLLSCTGVVIGLGALGSGVADLLARAGVGVLRLVDRDYVDESNLARQTLYDEEDCQQALPKAVAAARRLREINSEVQYEAVVRDVNFRNVDEVIQGACVVVDGTDNLETRYLINDACVERGIPWVYGACVGSAGMTFTVLPGEGPCLRCFIPRPPSPGALPTCDTAGILGPAAAAVAALEVAQAMRVLLGQCDRSCLMLKYVDVWEGLLLTLSLERDRDCPCCVRGERPYLKGEVGTGTTIICGREMVQVAPLNPTSLSLEDVARKLKAVGPVAYNGFFVKVSVPEGLELIVFSDGRALIKGTTDPDAARTVYARYLGS